jgi:hypothetical protein
VREKGQIGDSQYLYVFFLWYCDSERLIWCRVGLIQLIRFILMKLIYIYINIRFDMRVVFTVNYSFSGR